jgi:hypothetical protein
LRVIGAAERLENAEGVVRHWNLPAIQFGMKGEAEEKACRYFRLKLFAILASLQSHRLEMV